MHGEAMSCPDCNKKFGSTYTLETHRQNVHTDKSVKPFLCGQCPFATHSKGQEISEGKYNSVFKSPNKQKKIPNFCSKMNSL